MTERDVIRRELDARAVTQALWLAVDAAARAGWPDLSDEIEQLYADAIRRRRQLEEHAT